MGWVTGGRDQGLGLGSVTTSTVTTPDVFGPRSLVRGYKTPLCFDCFTLRGVGGPFASRETTWRRRQRRRSPRVPCQVVTGYLVGQRKTRHSWALQDGARPGPTDETWASRVHRDLWTK